MQKKACGHQHRQRASVLSKLDELLETRGAIVQNAGRRRCSTLLYCLMYSSVAYPFDIGRERENEAKIEATWRER
jgi:hypothetical protein